MAGRKPVEKRRGQGKLLRLGDGGEGGSLLANLQKPSPHISTRRPAETVAGSHPGIYEEMEAGAEAWPRLSIRRPTETIASSHLGIYEINEMKRVQIDARFK
ncbi:hypothetical protein AXF42_Ash009400 [Apostasia shenzhenica]|uniref:Uncharacterized protein n=1 Tax=Apostasia shenzhenica TaxID=1088818 RepID=A0A2I0B3Z9_9ASPA|nr:hypothetical protein AXF42_Ash009400 [Apostasia shenzhenica]